MKRLAFEELSSAPCVFKQKVGDGIYAYILVDVEDIVVFKQTLEQRTTVLEKLKSLYELRIENRISLYIGLKLPWKISTAGQFLGVKLRQALYIVSILRQFAFQNAKPPRSPIAECVLTDLLTEEYKSPMDVQFYEQMIGSLQ